MDRDVELEDAVLTPEDALEREARDLFVVEEFVDRFDVALPE